MDKEQKSSAGIQPAELTCYADCSFQYYADGQMVEDTGLITKDEGLRLIEKYKDDFADHCKLGHVAEMALWIEMNTEDDYRKTHLHIHSDDMIFKDGDLYELKRVFV
jgi:hypothetical protein